MQIKIIHAVLNNFGETSGIKSQPNEKWIRPNLDIR
jgi:hypothetical protein